MSELTERERAIRRGLRKEKRERWAHVRELILRGSVQMWLRVWKEYDKHIWKYIFNRQPTPHLMRHVRIELHYLKQSEDRQLELEQMFIDE